MQDLAMLKYAEFLLGKVSLSNHINCSYGLLQGMAPHLVEQLVNDKTIILEIGNYHGLDVYTPSNPHKWTLFIHAVGGAAELPCIEKVIFKLHSTFYPDTVVLDAPPFRISRVIQ